MKKNYLKVAFVHLFKNRTYSFVSILSLTIGMSVCILLLLYVENEVSYDRYHSNADQIYRLCLSDQAYQAPQTAVLLSDNLPEIDDYARILPRENVLVQYQDHRFKEKEIAYADVGLFRMFSFKFIQGSAETALDQPGTMVISQNMAVKYFGGENPMGKLLKLDNQLDYTITGVFAEMPENSHFRYDFFFTLADANTVFGAESMQDWGWQNFLVYLEIDSKFSKPDLEAKISRIISSHQKADKNKPMTLFVVQSLKDIHLYSSHISNDIQPQNSITYVLLFSAIGLLILLIACFNYINLLTANATTRVMEIGVRKVFGASRKQLAGQFISESFVILFISFCLSVLAIGLSLPFFNELSGKHLSVSALFQWNTMLGISGILLIVGVLAGCYPAFFLPVLQPDRVMKSSGKRGSSKFQLKKVLVIGQFIIVIALIGCSIVMFRQINYLKNKQLGFDKENVLVSDMNGIEDPGIFNSMKQELLASSLVERVSSGSRVPSGSLNNYGRATPEGQTEGGIIPYVHVDFNYFESLGIKAIKGRLFSDEYRTDAGEAIILNEAAVKKLGIQGNPVGQTVKCTWPKSTRKIVGVVNEFHFESLYEKIKPAVFVVCPEFSEQLILKVKPSADLNSISSINGICQKYYPDQLFEFQFLKDRLADIYRTDQRTFHLLGYFTVLAIIIACMGLFGMASFILTMRTREIGMRKVIGASVSEVVLLLNKDYLKWMAVAFIVATPIAIYVMGRWLETFAFKTLLSWWIFAVAGCLAIGLLLLTVSWQTYRAASRNPVETLRS